MLPAEAAATREGRTAADNATVRTVFVIGPDKKIKLMLTYPMSTGRNFDEVLRLLDSIQLTAKHKVATPANWKPGDDVIIVPARSRTTRRRRSTRTAGRRRSRICASSRSRAPRSRISTAGIDSRGAGDGRYVARAARFAASLSVCRILVRRGLDRSADVLPRAPCGAAAEARAETVEIHVDHRRDVERQQLREQQAADHRTGPAAGATPRRRPMPSAIGSVPISAAIVVIMIGRKRISRRLDDRLRAARMPSLRCALEREVDHHDRVLLHDADQHDDADERVERRAACRTDQSVSSAPNAADGRPDRIVSGWMKLS